MFFLQKHEVAWKRSTHFVIYRHTSLSFIYETCSSASTNNTNVMLLLFIVDVSALSSGFFVQYRLYFSHFMLEFFDLLFSSFLPKESKRDLANSFRKQHRAHLKYISDHFQGGHSSLIYRSAMLFQWNCYFQFTESNRWQSFPSICTYSWDENAGCGMQSHLSKSDAIVTNGPWRNVAR